jgi:drug/metabolite transporter (DMT)-like permease
MSLGVFLTVIGAAFLHALWNALIKMGTAKLTGMLILTLVQGASGLIIATRREQPAGQIWLWLLASGVFHTAYKLFLAYAYDRGDLSRVYPIALVTALRETSILFAVLIGWIFFAERMDLGKSLAAALIVAGVILTRL